MAVSVVLLLFQFATASAFQFSVGGHRGWTTPAADGAESYNQWAIRNRFHVGDSLYFKYGEDDSVLVVDRDGYGACETAAPLAGFSDGNTTFPLDRHGFFYFISGEPGHCESGQRLIVRVMVHPRWSLSSSAAAPGPAPAPAPALQHSRGSGSSYGSGSRSGSGTDSESDSMKSDAPAISSGFGLMAAALGMFMF